MVIPPIGGIVLPKKRSYLPMTSWRLMCSKSFRLERELRENEVENLIGAGRVGGNSDSKLKIKVFTNGSFATSSYVLAIQGDK